MKKYISLFLIVTLLIFTMMPYQISAGAPKLIYDVIDGTTKATIKAIEARKGFKVIDGSQETVKSSEAFTQAISKEMQDSAMGTFELIQGGGAINRTPLKNLPGWSKVIIGTGSVIIGADLAFEVYDKIQNGESVEFINDFADESNSYGGFHYGENLIEMTENGEFNAIPLYYMGQRVGQFYNKEKSFKNAIIHHVIDLNTTVRLIVTLNFENGSSVYRLSHNISKDLLPDFMLSNVRVSELNIPKANIVKKEVPEINPNQEFQILIVPDSEHFPDLNKAIEDNWDMVTDPERWLRENPQHDPTPDITPKPDVTPKPKYIPNPNFNPDLLPSIDNPVYIPNPDYNPEFPPSFDPTSDPKFDPISGEIEGKSTIDEPVPDLDFRPLFGAMGDIKKKFPFSIPWDLASQLSVFDVKPQAPEFTIDFSKFPQASEKHKVVVSLSILDPLATAARWFLTIVFDVAIILSIRRLLPE